MTLAELLKELEQEARRRLGRPGPEKGPDAEAAVPEPVTGATVPEPDPGATVPESVTGATVPKPDAEATVPEPDAGATVPESVTGATVPEPDPGATVPESVTGATVPEAYSGETVPEDTLLPQDSSLFEHSLVRGALLLDTYRVDSDAITGGMGAVWRVHHTGWDTDLAMKRPKAEMFQSDAQRENFIRECEAWIGLGLHPNIVACYYVREIAGVPAIFSEWMDNGSLENRIRDGAVYAGTEEEISRRLLDIAIQFARGLGYAHGNGLIHQDVKPDNLLLTKEYEAKVADFGLAKARLFAEKADPSDPGATHMTRAGGYTPAYCSPEQAEGGTITRRTDIYSWAVSVLELYYGSRPWTNGVVAGYGADSYYPGCRVPMPGKLQALLTECLSYEPDDRPHDLAAVESELVSLYEELFSEPYPRPEPNAASDTPDSLNNRALSFLDLGKGREAEKLWGTAAAIAPEHVPTVFNHTLYRWRGGEISDTEAGKAIEALPENGPLLDAFYSERGTRAFTLEESGLPYFPVKAVLKPGEQALKIWAKENRFFVLTWQPEENGTLTRFELVEPDPVTGSIRSRRLALSVRDMTSNDLSGFSAYASSDDTPVLSDDLRFLFFPKRGILSDLQEGNIIQDCKVGPGFRFLLQQKEKGRYLLFSLPEYRFIRECLLCGSYGNVIRFYEGRLVYLSDRTHYTDYDLETGEETVIHERTYESRKYDKPVFNAEVQDCSLYSITMWTQYARSLTNGYSAGISKLGGSLVILSGKQALCSLSIPGLQRFFGRGKTWEQAIRMKSCPLHGSGRTDPPEMLAFTDTAPGGLSWYRIVVRMPENRVPAPYLVSRPENTAETRERNRRESAFLRMFEKARAGKDPTGMLLIYEPLLADPIKNLNLLTKMQPVLNGFCEKESIAATVALPERPAQKTEYEPEKPFWRKRMNQKAKNRFGEQLCCGGDVTVCSLIKNPGEDHLVWGLEIISGKGKNKTERTLGMDSLYPSYEEIDGVSRDGSMISLWRRDTENGTRRRVLLDTGTLELFELSITDQKRHLSPRDAISSRPAGGFGYHKPGLLYTEKPKSAGDRTVLFHIPSRLRIEPDTKDDIELTESDQDVFVKSHDPERKGTCIEAYRITDLSFLGRVFIPDGVQTGKLGCMIRFGEGRYMLGDVLAFFPAGRCLCIPHTIGPDPSLELTFGSYLYYRCFSADGKQLFMTADVWKEGRKQSSMIVRCDTETGTLSVVREPGIPSDFLSCFDNGRFLCFSPKKRATGYGQKDEIERPAPVLRTADGREAGSLALFLNAHSFTEDGFCLQAYAGGPRTHAVLWHFALPEK